MNDTAFATFIRQKGRELYRPMPWRTDTRGYYILVSELMLQQTQVVRVIPKFEQFIQRFPDVAALAAAPLSEVLVQWQGLGYNRRAKYVHEAAQQIVAQGGDLPATYDALVALPGVGPNTAGALLVYAFNQPRVFVETNVRTVYLHHYFAGQTGVTDTAIGAALAATLDRRHPRQFYWALMDYGAWLKTRGINPNARSRHYARQAPLAGSVREVRGRIIKQLTRHGPQTERHLRSQLAADQRFQAALTGLIADGLVKRQGGIIQLASQ